MHVLNSLPNQVGRFSSLPVGSLDRLATDREGDREREREMSVYIYIDIDTDIHIIYIIQCADSLCRRRVKWCPFAGSGLLTADVLAEAAKRLWVSGTFDFSSCRVKSNMGEG